MAPAKSTASPTPGLSGPTLKTPRAMKDALYNWCWVNFDEEHVFSQNDLLQSNFIPNKNTETLIDVVQSLVKDHLFRTHELRAGGLGWKVVSRDEANKYKDLSADESLVYSIIESTGRDGAWARTIANKTNMHTKVVQSSIKTLTQRGYIKSMSTVKAPGKKMYILARLQPSEQSTGGTWFTDGVLDHELLATVAEALEVRISKSSWKIATDARDDPVISGPSRKRKEPEGGFESTTRGKEKMRQKNEECLEDALPACSDVEGEFHESPPSQKAQGRLKHSKRVYVPYPADYAKYPNLGELTEYINQSLIVKQTGKLPEESISQLLDVMVYDDRIIKILGPSSGSSPTMYRSRKNLAQLSADISLDKRVRDLKLDKAAEKKALRELELKRLGTGGMTEILAADVQSLIPARWVDLSIQATASTLRNGSRRLKVRVNTKRATWFGDGRFGG